MLRGCNADFTAARKSKELAKAAHLTVVLMLNQIQYACAAQLMLRDESGVASQSDTCPCCNRVVFCITQS